MIFRLLNIIGLSIFAPLCMWAESMCLEDLMKDENYIQASLIVVSPGDAIYSAGGHIALRMRCPTQNIDYVYEFDAKIDENESLIFKYLNGTLEGNYVRLFSDVFNGKLNDENRKSSDYILNLTPMQKVALWTFLDEEVDGENIYSFIPTTNNCCSMLLPLIEKSINSDILSNLNVLSIDKTTGREYLEDFFVFSPWTGLIWDILIGTEFDKPVSAINLLYPKIISHSLSLLVNPENGSNLLIDNKFSQESFIDARYSFLHPKYIFIYIFILSCCLATFNLKNRLNKISMAFDIMLLAISIIIGCILWYMFLASIIHHNTHYNMMLIIFNPVPIFLLLMRDKRVWVNYSLVIAIVATLYLLGISYIPQIQLYGLWLFIGAILVRSLAFYKNSIPKIFVSHFKL